jgi:hypothetical protein
MGITFLLHFRLEDLIILALLAPIHLEAPTIFSLLVYKFLFEGSLKLGWQPQVGGHNLVYGKSIPALQYQPWNVPFQGNQQPSRG